MTESETSGIGDIELPLFIASDIGWSLKLVALVVAGAMVAWRTGIDYQCTLCADPDSLWATQGCSG